MMSHYFFKAVVARNFVCFSWVYVSVNILVTFRTEKWTSLLIHLICVFDVFLHNRLVKSESSDSLLSQTSGNTHHHHRAVTSRKPRAEPSLPVTCPSVPVLSCETPKVTTKARSGQKSVHGPKTSRQMKESRSQKHTRVKIYFLFLSSTWEEIPLFGSLKMYV